MEIVQLGDQAESFSTSVKQGKGNLVYTLNGKGGEYTTLLYPFDSFSTRLPRSFADEKRITIGGWTIRLNDGQDLVTGGITSNAKTVIEHESGVFLLGVSHLATENMDLSFPSRDDLHIALQPGSTLELTWLGTEDVDTRLDDKNRNTAEHRLRPGARRVFEY